jgi:hypothetical protein
MCARSFGILGAAAGMSVAGNASAQSPVAPAAAGRDRIPARPGLLARWLKRRRALQRNVDHAVWDLRERYGEAAHSIAMASARAPAGFIRRRFWRKVAARLKRLG